MPKAKAAPAPVAVDFEVGDHVYVGEPHPDKVHWVIDFIPPTARFARSYPSVRLVSPMSNRSRVASLDSLFLHTKGDGDGDHR